VHFFCLFIKICSNGKGHLEQRQNNVDSVLITLLHVINTRYKTMKKAVMPYVLKAVSSTFLLLTKRKLHALRIKLFFQEAVLEIFIKVDDPYSYLLIQALASIKSRFSITLKFHVFNDIDPQMYPRLAMWQQYANYDAYHLAKLYGFQFPCQSKLPK
jgi:hypothetical protein